uniref:Uncharacterized protein n=1 Tax=Anguilla anguilla TaxID=7936 RepID=A0A0E9PKU6_ANGAN
MCKHFNFFCLVFSLLIM